MIRMTEALRFSLRGGVEGKELGRRVDIFVEALEEIKGGDAGTVKHGASLGARGKRKKVEAEVGNVGRDRRLGSVGRRRRRIVVVVVGGGSVVVGGGRWRGDGGGGRIVGKGTGGGNGE